MLRAVLLDIMDTVIRDPYREALEAATGRSLQDLFERRDASAYPAFERGEISEDEYWAVFADAGIEVDVAAFHATRRAGYRWLPGMAELLDDLAGTVDRLGATNYPCWIEELRAGMLAGRFEEVYASCELGARKPDQTFFDRLLDDAGYTADEVVFVDDRQRNVDGAAEAGIQALRFVGADELREHLRDAGLDV